MASLALRTLQIGFVVLGATALGIAVSNFLFGVAFTADIFATAFSPLGTAPGGFDALSDASVDAEFRFYSVFWGAYGAILIHMARRPPVLMRYAPALIGLFLLGGIGRALSWAVVGPPDTLFVNLMIAEFVLSPLLLAAWRVARPSPAEV